MTTVKNKFKQKLRNKELTFGAWIQIGHPAIAEIFANAGYDWICVDLEHGAIDLETMTNIFRTVDAMDVTPVVRVPKNDEVWIRRSLDAGAKGLIIPMINSAEEAALAIKAAKYPPQGERGYGYCRANDHGRKFQEYIQSANDEIVLIMQIEHKKSIENLEDILQLEGVEGVFIGPMDLSGSYGKSGDLTCPEMVKALDKYLKCCSKHSKSAGMHIVRPHEENIADAIQQGYSLIALGVDNSLLDEMASLNIEIANKLCQKNKN